MQIPCKRSSPPWLREALNEADDGDAADLFRHYAPMGFDAGDANLYRYVANQPTNATDASGLAKVAVDVELLDLDSAKKLPKYQEFLKRGEGIKWTDQVVKNKKVLVQVAKGQKDGKEYYAARYWFAIRFKSKVAGNFSLFQTVDTFDAQLDKTGFPVPGMTARNTWVEGLPVKDGVAIDPRGGIESIFANNPNPKTQFLVRTESFIGTFQGKTVDKTDKVGDKDDFDKIKPAPDTEGFPMEVDLTLSKDGEWLLKSTALNIDEKGQIK